MPFLRNITSGLRSLFRKNQVDRELDEELGAYLEMEGGWPGTPTPNFRLRSIERGNSRTLANQTDTEGAPGSSFEPGVLGLPSLARASRGASKGHSPRFLLGS
jgi:hypothetical protein